MKYIFPCIEQLDLSAEQLKYDNPAYARFSLILTDNIIELMLHKQCEIEILHDESRFNINEPKYNAGLKRKVLGQHFDEKVKFCKRIEKITQEELDFILICHKYRNELYHTGIKYEMILHPLSWYYHQLACRLFKKLKPYFFAFSSNDNPSETITKHIGNHKRYTTGEDVLEKAVSSLDMSRPNLENNLSWYLSQSATNVIENIIDAIEFIAKNAPRKSSIENTILNMQIWDFVFNSEEKGKSIIKPEDKIENPIDLLKIAKERWNPPVNFSKIKKWEERACSLKNEKNHTKALLKFDNLKRDITPFETLVMKNAIALDEQIQHEIDSYRGK